MKQWIKPDWPAPANISAWSTTREGGCSKGPWSSFNLGENSGDDPLAVANNRAVLAAHLPQQPCWLKQVHGRHVIRHPGNSQPAVASACIADAQTSDVAGEVCAILTADCLPVLFCDRQGREVAAAHAGWRGLAAGVLEETIASMKTAPQDLLAWMGPAIGPKAYEVGAEVKAAFAHEEQEGAGAFAAQADRWLFDLYAMARHRLLRAGVGHVSGGEFCTLTDAKRFFSYRRDSVTGRMASLIWIN
jgi:YfiH family protein